jgi:putative PIN family toxin of toxin-antitoxin system
MRRIVPDTNIAVSGLFWNGPPRQLLDLGRAGKILLLSSIPMLLELADVLSRAKFAHKIAASGLTIDESLQGYASLVTLVRPASVIRLAPDPDDDVVIGTAIAASADLLVTGDKQLLSVQTFKGGQIVSVAECFILLSEDFDTGP